MNKMRIILLALGLALVSTGCKKNNNEEGDSFSSIYGTGLGKTTINELREARNATERYQNLDSALADGYVDIAVDVENMGHHYMKAALVDSIFDKTKPEILVYNRDHDTHKPYLVAVEYAVPLTCAKPEGFTGSSDVWKGDSGFPLWLLHAWIYAYNPEGTFSWTNSLIHMH